MAVLPHTRILLALIPLLVFLAATPARAHHEEGSIVLPVAHPTVARSLHSNGVRTNLVGDVFMIPGTAKGQTYTLTRTSGVGNLDVYFYSDDDGEIGAPCNIPEMDDDELNPMSESGPICPGPLTPGWAIVVLRWGFNAGFEFHYD